MSSKKDDDKRPELTDQEKADSLPEDWSPDYFPTSAKPIFRKISILTVGILTLCLFLAYCSQNDRKSSSEPTTPAKTGNPPVENGEEENNEEEVF